MSWEKVAASLRASNSVTGYRLIVVDSFTCSHTHHHFQVFAITIFYKVPCCSGVSCSVSNGSGLGPEKQFWAVAEPFQNPTCCFLADETWTCTPQAAGPFSCFAFWVVPFMVTFRYPTGNRKILTMLHRCSFWMYWPPLLSNNVDKRSLTLPGNKRQWSVNDLRSCILSNQSGHWFQRVIIEVLASFGGKSRSDTLPAPSWKWASTISGLTAWVIYVAHDCKPLSRRNWHPL